MAKPLMMEETVQGAGGVEIFMRSYEPSGATRGVVVIVHGFKSHSGLYGWVASELSKQDFAVYTLDLRGHGRSGGERLYVESFDEYLNDVDRVVRIARAREPGVPIFILGHSAGGVVSCAYALEHQRDLAGLVCESFAYEVPAPWAALAFLRGLSHIAPHAHVLELKDEDFSRDPEFVETMRFDPLIPHMRYPTQTVAELARADERLRTMFRRMTLPVFILHGTDDKAAVPHGSQFFYEAAGSNDKRLELYEGAYHDLLNDYGKENVMRDITTWLRTHTTGPRANLAA